MQKKLERQQLSVESKVDRLQSMMEQEFTKHNECFEQTLKELCSIKGVVEGIVEESKKTADLLRAIAENLQSTTENLQSTTESLQNTTDIIQKDVHDLRKDVSILLEDPEYRAKKRRKTTDEQEETRQSLSQQFFK